MKFVFLDLPKELSIDKVGLVYSVKPARSHILNLIKSSCGDDNDDDPKEYDDKDGKNENVDVDKNSDNINVDANIVDGQENSSDDDDYDFIDSDDKLKIRCELELFDYEKTAIEELQLIDDFAIQNRSLKAQMLKPTITSWSRTVLHEDKITFKWVLGNFSALCSKTSGEFPIIKSEHFTFSGPNSTNLRIRVYPLGDSAESKDFVSLYLESESAAKLAYIISILNYKGLEHISMSK